MIESEESEPTRSVLHRSAASLAFRCGEYREAERLIARALLGNPPEEIADELRRLNNKINFHLRLQFNEMRIGINEFSIKLRGDEISESLTPEQLFTSRITNFRKMLLNTIGHQNGHDFASSAKLKSRKKYTLFLSPFTHGSFHIVFKLGLTKQQSLPELGSFDGIFNTILNNFNLLNSGQYKELQECFREPAYYHNFVVLAKEIAPDGSRVAAVDLGARVEGEQRQVLLERSRDDLSAALMPVNAEPANELRRTEDIRTVTGTLQYADAMEANEVKLQDTNSKKTWAITVPAGMMRNIVRPYFDERVQITGVRMAKERPLDILYLLDIKPTDQRLSI